jgi:hypothetical protein
MQQKLRKKFCKKVDAKISLKMKQKIYHENPKQKFLKKKFQKNWKNLPEQKIVKIFRKYLRNFKKICGKNLYRQRF